MKNSLAISIKKALVVGAILGGVLVTHPSLANTSNFYIRGAALEPRLSVWDRDSAGGREYGYLGGVAASASAVSGLEVLNIAASPYSRLAGSGEVLLSPQASYQQVLSNIKRVAILGGDTHRVFIIKGPDGKFHPLVNSVRAGVVGATPRLLGVR